MIESHPPLPLPLTLPVAATPGAVRRGPRHRPRPGTAVGYRDHRECHGHRDRHGRRRAPAALALVLAGLLLLTGAPPAPAIIPVTDVAHIALNAGWHYLHYVQLAYQIYQHYLQIANQVRQIDYQLRALRKLANPNWREIQSLLLDLDFLVGSGTAIGYALPDAGGQLVATFPGWTPWGDPTLAARQSSRALDTMRAGLAAISRQAQSLTPGEQTLADIRQQMATTQGHQQALEQLATLSTFAAQEQLLTRQSLAVSANLQAVSGAYWIDREAQGRAAVELVLAETSLAGYQSTSAGWTFQPPPQLR